MPTVGYARPPPPLPPVRRHTLPLPPPRPRPSPRQRLPLHPPPPLRLLLRPRLHHLPPLCFRCLHPSYSLDLRHWGQVPLHLYHHLLPLLAPLPPSGRPPRPLPRRRRPRLYLLPPRPLVPTERPLPLRRCLHPPEGYHHLLDVKSDIDGST